MFNNMVEVLQFRQQNYMLLKSWKQHSLWVYTGLLDLSLLRLFGLLTTALWALMNWLKTGETILAKEVVCLPKEPPWAEPKIHCPGGKGFFFLWIPSEEQECLRTHCSFCQVGTPSYPSPLLLKGPRIRIWKFWAVSHKTVPNLCPPH